MYTGHPLPATGVLRTLMINTTVIINTGVSAEPGIAELHTQSRAQQLNVNVLCL